MKKRAYISNVKQTNKAMNIQKEVKKIIKATHTKGNEIISINFDANNKDWYGLVHVTLASTCEIGKTMTWTFLFEYDEGNADCFDECGKIAFADKIIHPSVTVKCID